jgi:transposase InsO family protein
MRLYAATGVAARRFVHRHRNRLWHSDVKFGPYLPIGPNGAKKQVYLVTFIDDATRLVLHGEFYPTLDAVIVENCFRKAIHKFGVPETVYFDNGKQYRTKWMTRACSKLGIRLLFAKPYSPESTGKVERFNRMVDAFLAEAALEKTTDFGPAQHFVCRLAGRVLPAQAPWGSGESNEPGGCFPQRPQGAALSGARGTGRCLFAL